MTFTYFYISELPLSLSFHTNLRFLLFVNIYDYYIILQSVDSHELKQLEIYLYTYRQHFILFQLQSQHSNTLFYELSITSCIYDVFVYVNCWISIYLHCIANQMLYVRRMFWSAMWLLHLHIKFKHFAHNIRK